MANVGAAAVFALLAIFVAQTAGDDPRPIPRGLLAHSRVHHTVHGLTSVSTDSFNAAAAFASHQAQGLAAYGLGRMASQCKCKFKGLCGCDAALEFMDCIAASCTSGTCNCQNGMQFLYACHNMSAVCPTTGLMCASDSASCLVPQVANASEPKKLDAAVARKAEKAAAPAKESAPAKSAPAKQERNPLQIRNVRYFHATPWPANKLLLALVSMSGLGTFGCDRCMMGQMTVGIFKAVTFGGCGIWACVDYVVIAVNCLMFWSTLSVVGYDARFQKWSINWAFWVTLFFFIAKCVLSAFEGKRRQNKGSTES